ncbi:M67 family metallopeptidase [Acidobacteria bacterium AH-259-A15]|nr:M67 family metallopeptidase [Acidobacteria bacterium AH-259-A15]
MIRLKTENLEQIKQLAEQTYPHECCGIMVGSVKNGVKTVTELIPAENQRSDSPANRYLITADFLRQLERRLRGTGSGIMGFFHSHPDVPARPSSYDQEHAWPWYSYLIVCVRKGRAKEVHNWRLKDDRSAFDPEKLKLL